MPEPTPANLAFNIAAGEVLQPQAVIELHASRPVGPRSAQGAISVARGCSPVPIEVELRERGRVAVVRTEGLDPGGYVLNVSAHFTEPQLLDLLALAGWYHAIAYLARGARVPLEPGAPTLANA